MPTQGVSAEGTSAHEALGDLCWGDGDHRPSAPARLWEKPTGEASRAHGCTAHCPGPPFSYSTRCPPILSVERMGL